MALTQQEKQSLLQNSHVIEEIKRHLWIESEKAGKDIGYDKAASQWLEQYAEAWVAYHMPKKFKSKPETAKADDAENKRKAKTYLK